MEGCIFRGLHLWRAASSEGCIFGGLHLGRAASSEGCIFGGLHLLRAASLEGCIFRGLHLWRAASSEGCIFGGLHLHTVEGDAKEINTVLKAIQTKRVWGSEYNVSLAQVCMSNPLKRMMQIERLVT